MSEIEHLVGLLLGTEDDWPRAYAALVRGLGPIADDSGTSHRIRTVRVTIEPFNLRYQPRHSLVIDRLAYWYYHPREWLKKIALMDDVYLLNSPFTFQSMELHAAYDASGERLMHLQQAVENYDVFTRSLSIGPETMVMKFRPELPMHDRYAVEHDFLSDRTGAEVVTISRLVNAFFRWEFNSCESLVRGTEVYPIDYANACPDVALTSLHYYFPWAMAALLRWSVFCVVTGRRPRLDTDTARYFAIADRDDLSYEDKLAGYRELTDEYFETDRYAEFCATRLGHVDELVYDWVRSPDFDTLLLDTVRATYPPAEHDRYIAHFRGLLGAWVNDQRR